MYNSNNRYKKLGKSSVNLSIILLIIWGEFGSILSTFGLSFVL